MVPSTSSRCSVPDLNHPEASVVVLVKVDVDGEMGVDVAHLVLEALGDTNDHVVDERAHGAESGDVLAGTVVHLNLDDIGSRLLEGDGQVTEILLEGAAGTLDSDLASLDVDLDCTEKDPLVLSCPCRDLSLAPWPSIEFRLIFLGMFGRRGLSHWCCGIRIG